MLRLLTDQSIARNREKCRNMRLQQSDRLLSQAMIARLEILLCPKLPFDTDRPKIPLEPTKELLLDV